MSKPIPKPISYRMLADIPNKVTEKKEFILSYAIRRLADSPDK